MERVLQEQPRRGIKKTEGKTNKQFIANEIKKFENVKTKNKKKKTQSFNPNIRQNYDNAFVSVSIILVIMIPYCSKVWN